MGLFRMRPIGIEPMTPTVSRWCSPSELRSRVVWQRPTLPGPCGPSTIGAGGLNCRVRDGNECVPSAIITRLGLATFWHALPEGAPSQLVANVLVG